MVWGAAIGAGLGLLGNLMGGGETPEQRNKRLLGQAADQVGDAGLLKGFDQFNAMAGQDRMRAMQQAQGINQGFGDLVAMQQAAARGEGPSLAGIQGQQMADRAALQARSAALSAPVGQQAAAARGAQQAATAQQGSVAGNTAMARAQEIMNARQGLASALTGANSAQTAQQQTLANLFRNQLAAAQAEQSGTANNQQMQQSLFNTLQGQQQQPSQGQNILSGISGLAGAFL